MTTDDRRELEQAALNTLKAMAPADVSTNDLADALHISDFERSAYLYPILTRNVRRGVVERLVRPEMRCRYWRWVGVPS